MVLDNGLLNILTVYAEEDLIKRLNESKDFIENRGMMSKYE